MNPSKCPYCGTDVPPTANYCGSCGTPLRQAERSTPPRRRERPGSRVAVWLFVLVLLTFFGSGALAGFRYHSGRWPWIAAVPVMAEPGPEPVEPPDNLPEPAAEPADAAMQQYMRATVSIRARGQQGSKAGSGFILDAGGHIVTSAHVVEGFTGCVNVIDDNGTTHQGIVVNLDRNLDVAMIYTPTLVKWPDVLSLSPEPIAVGDPVYALGSPKGTPNSRLLPANVQQTGLNRRIDGRFYADLIEFRGATVLHGSSGGPLLHQETGQVVGIVTAAADAPIAYAIPVRGEVASKLQQWISEPVTMHCTAESVVETVPLVLATVTPLSGPYGVWGSDLASGAELALRDMEADLAKVGYEVTLARYDDKGEAELARQHAASAAYDQGVIGVVGSFTNPATEELAEALAGSGLVMVAPLAVSEGLTGPDRPHVNQLLVSNVRMGAQAAAYARHRLGSRSIMLLLDGSQGADLQAASFETAAQIVSLPVVGRLSLPSAIDGASLARAVQASGADAVYYAGNSKTGFQVAQALRQQGLTLPLIGGPELYSPAFENSENADMRAIYFTHFTEGTGDRFARHFETILGKPTRGYGMFGYDAARVILEALVTYGESHPGIAPTRAELAELVRATQGFGGYSSTVSFDEATGENRAAKVYIFEWVNGRYELRE